MAKKNESGIVGLVRGVSAKYERCEDVLTEVEASGRHLQKNLPEMLSNIETLENNIREADTELESLQARREELQREYVSATFSEDDNAQQEIIAERRKLDQRTSTLTNERDTASTNLNRLRGNLQVTRENAFAALDEVTVPSEENFLDTFIEALGEQTEAIHKRMHAAELLYELPEETAAREQAEIEAEQAAQSAERLRQRQELTERRNYYGRLLNNLSSGVYPHTGHRAWTEYLSEQGIEHVLQSTGERIFFRTDEVTGKRERIEPTSIVADVKQAYYAAMQELGEEVTEPEKQKKQPRLTRDQWVSVGHAEDRRGVSVPVR